MTSDICTQGHPDNTLDPDWLHGLNDVQKQAVQNVDGACLVLAGAGTGKTRVLTTRIVHLLYLKKALPYEILCVTFTNKAAAEMRERVERYTGVVSGLWLGTFHSLCLRILRKYASLVGLDGDFIILDDAEQTRILKDIFATLNVDTDKYPARHMMSHIQAWKDKSFTPSMIHMDMVGDLANGHLHTAYVHYQERLQSLNAVDFGDLILHVVTLFQNHPDVLSAYQDRFKYIFVDEYQDTNTAQYKWLQLLAKRDGRAHICCVGDDDQSVYGWRGADVENILRFETDFENATIIRLEQNYRSRQHILDTANAVISHNQNRLGKTLFTELGQGDKVNVVSAYNGDAEAEYVASAIESAHGTGEKYGDMAVLVRAGYLTRGFESRFFETDIPYKVVGGAKFYEREEIRDVVAYLRVIYQTSDDLAFERIVNKPTRGIGKATLQTLHTVARASHVSLYQGAVHILQGDDLPKRAKNALQNVIDMFEKWRKIASDSTVENAHIQALKTMLNESGYGDYWKHSKDIKAKTKLDNIRELETAMQSFQNLGGYLEHIALHMDTDDLDTDDSVSIMTLHSAKGLEFERVFLVGWEEGLFPSERTIDELGEQGLEEERRLAYVGITRTQKKCQISYAHSRVVHGQWKTNQPSRFIHELPKQNIEIVGHFNGYTKPSYTPTDGMDGIDIYEPSQSHTFNVGDRCFHQKFGMGTVARMDGDFVMIAFDNAGTKKVLASFVETV